MAFCTACGNQMEDGSLFCTHCGARQDAPESAPASPVSSQDAAPQDSTPQSFYTPASQDYTAQAGYGSAPYGQPAAAAATAPRKPLPKGVKIGLIAAAAIVVVLVLFSFIMGRINSPQKTISGFIESIMAQDYDKFSSVTCSASEELELTEEAVAPFFALYNDNLGYLESFQESLSSDLTLLERGKASLGNGTVRLVEHNRLLFKTYEVELSCSDFILSTNIGGAQIEVGSQSITLAQDTTEGTIRLLPGLYDIHATLSNDTLGECSSTELLGCALLPDNNYWYINLDYGCVYLDDVGLDVASLTVNGVEYGPIEFNEYGEFAIMPLPRDVEIVVTYDAGGVTLSDSFLWSEGNYCWSTFYPQPATSEETALEMLNATGTFLRSMFNTYASGDVEALRAMIPNNVSSVLNSYASELESSLDPDRYSRRAYHYTVRAMEGDLSWTRESSSPLCFSTLVVLDLDYTYETYRNNALYDSSDDVLSRTTNLRMYVQLIDGEWVVSDMETTYRGRNYISSPYEM